MQQGELNELKNMPDEKRIDIIKNLRQKARSPMGVALTHVLLSLNRENTQLNLQDFLEMMQPNLCLAGMDFSFNYNLSSINFSRVNLYGAYLSFTDLSCANLLGANLSYSDLFCADLSCANLADANLSYANLSCTNLYMASLSYSNLKNTDLRQCSLHSNK